LKTEGSERRVPLVGVSLDALRAIKDMGGCTRYRDKENHMSNTINKYLGTSINSGFLSGEPGKDVVLR
jgi:hypothetical protein